MLVERIREMYRLVRHRDAVAMFACARLSATRPATWADLGCGDGPFTLALAELLSSGSLIQAIDRDTSVLTRMPATTRVRIETHVGDFTRAWPFGGVFDGILMANSFHYVAEQAAFLARCAAQLSASGNFLVVEYDTDVPNRWVPYPASFASLSRLFSSVGFVRTERVSSRRSRYQRAPLYCALASRRETSAGA